MTDVPGVPVDKAPEEDSLNQDDGTFSVIDLTDFYDLLMEQQEQM